MSILDVALVGEILSNDWSHGPGGGSAFPDNSDFFASLRRFLRGGFIPALEFSLEFSSEGGAIRSEGAIRTPSTFAASGGGPAVPCLKEAPATVVIDRAVMMARKEVIMEVFIIVLCFAALIGFVFMKSSSKFGKTSSDSCLKSPAQAISQFVFSTGHYSTSSTTHQFARDFPSYLIVRVTFQSHADFAENSGDASQIRKIQKNYKTLCKSSRLYVSSWLD